MSATAPEGSPAAAVVALIHTSNARSSSLATEVVPGAADWLLTVVEPVPGSEWVCVAVVPTASGALSRMDVVELGVPLVPVPPWLCVTEWTWPGVVWEWLAAPPSEPGSVELVAMPFG